MDELERLRAENSKLRNIADMDDELRRTEKSRRIEVKRLKRENLGLRNRKKIIVVKKIGSGLASVGKTLYHGLDAVAQQAYKAEQSKRRVKKVKRVSGLGGLSFYQ